jgi:transposase
LAAEASVIGHGGINLVSKVTGVSRRAIREGIKELKRGGGVPAGRDDALSGKQRVWIRRPGGGRRPRIVEDPTLLKDLESLVEPVTRGDPQSPLRWTCKSVRRLADELKKMGHETSHHMVAGLLHDLGYSLQANRKTLEGADHPDRNAQFEHINEKVNRQMASKNPVISVDSKKKELVGNFKNAGKEWRPKGNPMDVEGHDFVIPQLGRVTPSGVYDQAKNTGWVSVGIDHDTATFAVETIRRWWKSMGSKFYPRAKSLLITADGGGSNGYRLRLWKVELQTLANELGFPISVCHFPPGTSKWNKIEHRLFSFISQNWRGKPLTSHEVIVNLIANTTTKTGLTVQCELDKNTYPKGQRVSDEALSSVNLTRDHFHGEWNYTVAPACPS